MPKFDVSGVVTISISKTIEAEGTAEALALAAELELPSLCFQCAGGGGGDPAVWELAGELDGEPQVTNVAVSE